MSEAPMIQAMVWYREEDWQHLLNIFSDVHLLPTTYGEWLVKANQNLEKAKESGDVVVKVFIDPEVFPDWCKKRSKQADAEARTQFAIDEVTKQQFGGKI